MKKLFLYLILFVGLFLLCFLLANEYFSQRMQEKNQNKLEIAADSIAMDVADADSYIVGIKDEMVIVYEAASGQVYEYTDIDADLLKKLHPDLYSDLEQTIRFYSKKELYRYLESLSS